MLTSLISCLDLRRLKEKLNKLEKTARIALEAEDEEGSDNPRGDHQTYSRGKSAGEDARDQIQADRDEIRETQ